MIRAAAALLLLLPALPQDAPGIVRLPVDRADAAVPLDLGGRGLFVLSGRSATWWTWSAAKSFSPSGSFRFDADAYLWTTATFADDPTPQVVSSGVRGLRRHPRRPDGSWGPAEDLVVHENLFRGDAQADAPPLASEFMPDLTGDGLSDALLFQHDGIWIFVQSKNAGGKPEFRLSQKLPLPVESETQLGWAAHHVLTRWERVPLVVRGDYDGDGRPDLVWFQDDQIGAFLQRADGRFEVRDALLVGEKRPKRRSTYFRFEVPPRIADFDGDGLVDVAVSHPSKGRVVIHMNRKGRIDFANPDSTLNVEGWSTGLYVEDLDRDGKKELVLGAVEKLGVFSGLGAFVSRKIDLQLHFFRLDASGTYPAQPVQVLKFPVPFTFSATRDNTQVDLSFWPTFAADLDGDGLQDLLLESEPGKIRVHRGRRSTLVEPESRSEIPYEPAAGAGGVRVLAGDFNGDGRSDLVLLQQVIETRKSELRVLLSRQD